MSKQRRQFTAEQKAAVVRRHLAGKEPVINLADQLNASKFFGHGGRAQIDFLITEVGVGYGHRAIAARFGGPAGTRDQMQANAAELEPQYVPFRVSSMPIYVKLVNGAALIQQGKLNEARIDLQQVRYYLANRLQEQREMTDDPIPVMYQQLAPTVGLR